MDQATRVQRLRLPGQGLNAAHAKQQVTRWLDKQTPARLGLPSDAIVLLRSVRTPWSALHPDSQADVLAPRLRGAVRPAMGTSPGSGCDAVWFADEAELLACLAHDSLQGQIGHRWWWRTWLGRQPTTEEALHAWLKSARAAPAAMGRLDAMGHGLAWARHIGSAGRLALLHAMQGHLPVAQAATAWLTQALSDAAIGMPPGAPEAGSASEAPLEPQAGNASHRASAPPLARMPPGPPHHDGALVLQALCSLLHGSPHLALDARQLTARLALAAGTHAAGHGQARRHDNAPGQGPGAAQPTHRHAARPSPSATEAQLAGQANAPDPTPGARQNEHGQHAPVAPRNSAPSNDETGPTATPGSPTTRSTVLTQDPVAPPGSLRVTRSPAPIHTGQSPTTQTSHGGVFFLLNVALAWELYGDFTRPRHALLSVSPWQFLHAAGIALLGRTFANDPVAGWLRAQAPLGRPRPATALGAAPLALLPEAQARWLRSPMALAPIDAAASTPPRPARRADDELSCWWPLLRQRLSLALNLPEREAIATCLSLPARIERRSERVDVVFALHHLPLAVRLAGLDRNPGWVPASGCDVRFQFEA